jgi:hypothetical protein
MHRRGLIIATIAFVFVLGIGVAGILGFLFVRLGLKKTLDQQVSVRNGAKANSSGAEFIAFKDDPGAFDGKTLTGKFRYQMTGSIRDTIGKQTVSFGMFAYRNRDHIGDSVSVDIWVWPPNGLEYPNLTAGDEAIISFTVSEKGKKANPDCHPTSILN